MSSTIKIVSEKVYSGPYSYWAGETTDFKLALCSDGCLWFRPITGRLWGTLPALPFDVKIRLYDWIVRPGYIPYLQVVDMRDKAWIYYRGRWVENGGI
ncbi:hypothetical protein A6E01_20580 (plasmid) [Vibrio breoganii]|uniref:Uncharacterized protein n=1 Tax=Vibrio breoganii TaxID=553239 RepID=A0AAN0XZP8_9VIBR|nr:hypothetical protein A6E01_20580 [Vibrio breoganii]